MNIAHETQQIDVTQAGAGRGAAGAERAFAAAFYENEIPDFVEGELERLYESVYCTMKRFRIYGEAEGASTYVARSGNAIACVILFRLEGRVVKVINQQIALSPADLLGFAQAVFARYRRAHAISFYAIDARLERFAYPFQAFEVLEENVLRLPATAEAYMENLSQNLLKRLNAAEKKLKRDFPNHRFDVLDGASVTEETLRTVVGLAGARMAAKQQDAYIHEDDIPRILQLIHAYGHVGLLVVDGQVRGGNVFYGVGGRYFMHIIAHDPDYDKYMLGYMVQYLAACHCITLGGRECCLMGGGSENKARFGATRMYLSSVDIFRSPLHRALSVRRVWAGAARRWLHRARHGLAQLAQADNAGGRLAARCLALLRSMRHVRAKSPGAAK